MPTSLLIQSRFCLLTLLTLSLMAITGCDSGWQAKTQPAQGSLFINGEPAAGALVRLIAISGAVDPRESMPWGNVNSDGSYILSTYEHQDGAPIGDYAVTVLWQFSPELPWDRMKGQFDSVEKAAAKVTIAKGKNEIPKIELTGVKILPQSDISKFPKLP